VGDSVDRYCAASASGDIDALAATLADDVEVVSPLSGRLVFRGREDVRFLLDAVYSGLSGLRWDQVPADGDVRVAIGEMRVAGLRLTDAMVFDLDANGLIKRVRPHLRPWLATTVFALVLGPKVARRPEVVVRALRGA
jgi:hypothetical protein